MTWRVEPFAPDHLKILELQQAQAFMRPIMDDDYAQWLAGTSTAFSGFDGDRLVGCAGVLPFWSGTELAWALLANTGLRAFIGAHRAVQAFLDDRPTRRIETMVDCGHLNGHRWARMLGFICEAPCMLNRSPDGRDMALYARTR
jgi:hypothetical protein